MRRGLWLLTPLLLLALLYAALPGAASYFVVRWLESRGFDDPELELEYPGYRQLRIPHLSLGQNRDGRRVLLRAAAVEIDYDLPTLLFERRLSRVRVPEVELSLADNGASPGTASAIDLAPLLPAAWLTLAPADRIQIGQLRLDHRAPGQPARRLQGNLDLHLGTLNSRLQLKEDEVPRARLDLQLDADRFDLALLDANAPVYRARGRYRADAGHLLIDLEQRLWLARAQAWQRHWLPLGTALPAADGELRAEGRLSLPLAFDPADPRAWHRLEADLQLAGGLALQQPAPQLERLQMTLDARLQLSEGQLRLRQASGGDIALGGLAIAPFETVDGAVRLQSPLELSGDLGTLPAGLHLAPLGLEIATGPLQHPAGTLSLAPLQLQLDAIDALDPERPAFGGRLVLSKLDWRDDGGPVGIDDFEAAFELGLDGRRLQLRLPDGARAGLRTLPLPPFEPLSADLRLASPLSLDVDLDEPAGSARLTPLHLVATPAPLRHPQGQLQLSPLDLQLQRIDLQQPAAEGRLRIDRIRWQTPDQRYPAASLNADLNLAAGRLGGRFGLDLDDPALHLSGRASTKLTPFDGELRWRADPLPLQKAEQLWNRYHPPAPPELTVAGGRLHLEGSADWNPAGLALRQDLRVEGLAANWGASRILDGEWRARTLVRRDGRLEQDGQLRIPLLDVGFPIETVETAYRYRQAPGQAPQLNAGPLRAALLGGGLEVDSVAINPFAPKMDTRVRLDQVQLARLLELQQQPGLSGQGSLQGTLPLRFDDTGLRVRDGRIANTTPGWIRFEPDAGVAALGQSNPGMAMALQALRNFRYEVLSVDLQYSPDGATRMQTRLKGHNPDWNRGQPVDFNINIEQNLLKLLRTLQFTDKLTESIEKRYR